MGNCWSVLRQKTYLLPIFLSVLKKNEVKRLETRRGHFPGKDDEVSNTNMLELH